MNWLDIVLGILIGYSLIAGLVKGITRIGIGLAAVVVGLLCGLWFHGNASVLFDPYIESREARNLAGFFTIFLGAIILGGLLSWLIGRLLKIVHLTWLDRLLGGVFGLARGLLVSAVIVLGIMAFTPGRQPPHSVVHSRVAPYVVEAARVMAAAAPHDFKEGFHRSYSRVKQIWAEMLKKGLRKPPSDRL